MCTSPIDGWRGVEESSTGKYAIVFDIAKADVTKPVTIPCGRCMECRLRKKREWALRCQHEADMHLENSLFCLTYDNEHLPRNGDGVPTLRKRDLSDFLKRLRHYTDGKRVKFFACGEYGGRFERPHYHVLLFGFGFPDKVRGPERNGFRSWNSEILDKTWKKGLTEIGEFSFDGVAYVAKYITKKDLDEEELFWTVDLEPPFIHMSRGGRHGKGIGYEWWLEFGREVLDNDSVICNGKEVAVPRYYDGLNEDLYAEAMAKIKAVRKARVNPDEQRSSRLLARQKCVEAAVALYD